MSLLSRSPVRSLLAAVALLFVASANAAIPAGVTPAASVEGITEYDLDNGLQVLLFPDASQAHATVNVTYLVGSRHGELRRDRHGAPARAHGVQGHAKTRRNMMAELGQRGMRVQRHDLVRPHQLLRDVPASDDNLDWALGMEADRMVNSTVVAQGPRQRDDGGAQRDGERRKQSRSAC